MQGRSNSVNRVSFKRQILVTLVALCLTLIVGVPTSKADMILSFGPSVPDPMLAGGGGFVDVFVRSDILAGQLLDGYQVGVTIAPGGGLPGPAGGLIFSAAQAEAELTNPTYVFFGNSFDTNNAVIVGTVTGGGTGYIGADITDNFVPVTLPFTNRLLFRLDLSAVSQGSYTISVNSGVTNFFANQLDPVGTPIAFTGTSSGLNVISAVPEPASFLIMALGSAGMLVFRRRSRVQVVA